MNNANSVLRWYSKLQVQRVLSFHFTVTEMNWILYSHKAWTHNTTHVTQQVCVNWTATLKASRLMERNLSNSPFLCFLFKEKKNPKTPWPQNVKMTQCVNEAWQCGSDNNTILYLYHMKQTYSAASASHTVLQKCSLSRFLFFVLMLKDRGPYKKTDG